MEKIIKDSLKTHILSKQNIIDILSTNMFDNILFNTANQVREKYIGNKIHLRGLIEFSNICKQNCQYCGLQYENKNIHRYRLSVEEIINSAKNASSLGFKTIVLQSGEDPFFDLEKMIRIISEIKKLNVAITLSIGEKTLQEYKAYKSAGADRYLLRIETSDINLYKNLHPNMDYSNRIECLKNLKSLGFEVGTGSLIGLPNQSLESIANDILFFKEINADMIGVGPFIANPNTKLKNVPNGNLFLAIKVIAITRILLPDINIPATTAIETLQKNGRIIALQSGANVIMPNMTDIEYRKNYELYPGKTSINQTPIESLNSIINEIKGINREISNSYGFRAKTDE